MIWGVIPWLLIILLFKSQDAWNQNPFANILLEFYGWGPRTNVNWISSLSDSDRLEIQLTFGFRCWWLNEAKTRPRARPCYMGVDLCTAHNWGPCGQLPGLKTWGAHQELATRDRRMFGIMVASVSMTWMNVLMPRCLLSLVILLETSPTYHWKL